MDWSDPEIYVWLGAVAVVLVVVGFIVSAVVAGYVDVKVRPRHPMYWCHKHGPFPAEYLLDLIPGMDGAKVCPTCYKEAVFTGGKHAV